MYNIRRKKRTLKNSSKRYNINWSYNSIVINAIMFILLFSIYLNHFRIFTVHKIIIIIINCMIKVKLYKSQIIHYGCGSLDKNAIILLIQFYYMGE